MTKKTIADWQALAEKELKRPADALTWHTPEGIDVKPLYTADDIAGIEHLDSLPGFAPGDDSYIGGLGADTLNDTSTTTIGTAPPNACAQVRGFRC